jgi:DNA processing protein
MDSTDIDNTAAWLALLRAPGLGCRTLNPLIAAGHSPLQLLNHPPEPLASVAGDYLAQPAWEAIEHDLAWLREPSNHLLTIDQPSYPQRLRELSDPPSGLFLHGDPELLGLPQLAIVGSRHPSRGGELTAGAFAEALAGAGLVISSGLAAGVDAAAHRGALRGGGLTIAVAGTGLDRVYPAAHRELAHEIASNGLLLSEFPLGTPPKPGNFPRRNRIIAGLCLGTLVVEAALKSGSLITARLAAEAGREVFAIPGSIHNPLARGCHRLIRNGAKLVETSDDVLEEIGPLLPGFSLAPVASMKGTDVPTGDPAEDPLDPQHRDVLEALGYDPATTDELAQRTGFPTKDVSSILLLLELRGHVSSGPGGQFTRLGNQPE